MAIYKSSNCSPQLSEIDFTQNNTFSCVINTSGEPAKAYKLKILSENGDTTYYEPANPTDLTIPVQNKDVLQIKNVSNSLNNELVNGKNYLWGVRVYNAPANSTAQPNTLVTEGFIVGSTKYVIWSRIPKAQTTVLEQLKYDRYIEFEAIAPANMFKGAKDDTYPLLPTSAYTERRKIDWVTTELGDDEDIVKIETTEPFTYNYIDGIQYKIYQCSDEHTVKNVYADPNSNINISNYIMIYNSLANAQSARTAGNTPANITVTMADCMLLTSGTGYAARKIGGYSSDTGEIRILDSFKVAPVNGQYYRLFEYDTIEKTYKAVDDAVYTAGGVSVDPLSSHRIGGTAIENGTYFKTLTNIWTNGTRRMFIQPNINILSDDTNPDEIVFENGARINIKKKTKTVNGEVIDITINKLDNTQWLLEGNSSTLPSSGTVPTICQTDYKVYTDFSDTSPYNLFYARKAPTITLQYRNAWEEVLSGTYVNATTFNDVEGNAYTPSSLYLYYDIPTDRYYRYNVYDYIYELTTDVWYNIIDSPSSLKDFREAEFRCLWKDSGNNDMLDPQIKSYQFFLYTYNESSTEKTLIAQSDEYYNITPSWIFRGLDGTETSVYNRNNPHHYSIQIKIIDEYDKEYIVENGFYIFYITDESPMPISVNLDCDEQALDVEINSPTYATTISSGDLVTVTADDLNEAAGQMVIGSGETLNYAKLSTDDIDLSFPATFSLFTQFQITEDFVNNIPAPTSDVGYSELPLFEIVHKLYDSIIYSGTQYFAESVPQYTLYYSDINLNTGVGELQNETSCVFISERSSSINLNGTTYYVATPSAGYLNKDAVTDITYINDTYSTIRVNGVEYYVQTSDVYSPLLEKYIVKLNSFMPYYIGENNQLYRNDHQYKLKVYREGASEALQCFTINNHQQDYFNVINPDDDGTFPAAAIKFALQSLTDSGSKYVEATTLGNPASASYDLSKRYILYTASTGYANIVYQAGIYRVLENADGHRYWALAGEDEYIFLEDTAQLNAETPVTYDDLSVPQNARATSGETGAINYMDITGSSTDNVWLDSTLSTISYDELLYNKFVNLFLKVILNSDQTRTVTCEVSIGSKGV